jgi:hypothetical protein
MSEKREQVNVKVNCRRAGLTRVSHEGSGIASLRTCLRARSGFDPYLIRSSAEVCPYSYSLSQSSSPSGRSRFERHKATKL